MACLIIGIVLGYIVFAVINVTTSDGNEGRKALQCPPGYYCMTNADEQALQTFIDKRCVKLDRGRY